MSASSLDSPDAPLAHWLRLLWDVAPPLRSSPVSPFIADGAIHLPARAHWRQQRAAAAHAAAHLVYSPCRFDARGLDDAARALVALLEDARVEALAVRELPGLGRLWRPLHTASARQGDDAAALARRLARALADPGYDDPDPWVREGRHLFFVDERLGLLALRTPAEVRDAALRLRRALSSPDASTGARMARAAPAYRDDHRWMWTIATPPPAPDPEWERLIARLRSDRAA